MSLKELTEEQLKEMAMVEVAYELFEERRKPYVFSELVEEVAGILELTKQQVEDKIAQFYTDINIDGRFICVGENMWGLRTWYPYEQIEEEIVPVAKPKKKKAKKSDDDLDDVYDELEDEDLDYDDFDDTDEEEEDFDDDLDADDDDDLDDEDDDDDLLEDDEDYDDLDDDEDDEDEDEDFDDDLEDEEEK